jgi:hypothetical protein
MAEEIDATEMTREEALINAGFRKRYFVSLYKSIPLRKNNDFCIS